MLCSNNIKFYMGDPLQVRGAEELVLRNNAKGNGMRLLYIRNGLGLEVFLSLDRAGDVARVNFKGDNLGFFAPCGFVAPQYFDMSGAFLRNFTAGFFTTCGLTNVGEEGFDGEEKLAKHGTISCTPAKLMGLEETNAGLTAEILVKEASLFGTKLTLKREYFFSYTENVFTLKDTVENVGDIDSPYMILYHCNMGYPLLSENATLKIPGKITPYNDWAAQNVDTVYDVSAPDENFKSRCYYFDVDKKNGFANVGIYNEKINKGLLISYSKETLDNFTLWKLLRKGDYVIGLEPSNCSIDGRVKDRKRGILKTLKPNETTQNTLKFAFSENKKEFEDAF